MPHNQDTLLHLWQGVCNIAYHVALRYRNAAQLNGGLDVDDLKQCAFLGFFNALNTYDPDKGEFVPHMTMYIKKECRKALGLTGRERREHYDAISTETPVIDELTIEDMIQDPDAAAAFDQAEMQADIQAALHRLPSDLRELIRMHYMLDMPMDQIAILQNRTIIQARKSHRIALQRLRKDKAIRGYERPVRFRCKGFRSFLSDWTSVVEADAIRHLDRKF